MAFIYSRLSRLRFSLKRDMVDHCDILLLSFFNREECYFLMNVYSDDRHSAVKLMLDQIIDIPNLLYMGGTLTSEMQSGIHLSPHILQLARP